MSQQFLTKWNSKAYIEQNFLSEDELKQAKEILDTINIKNQDKVITNHKYSENIYQKNQLKIFCEKIEKKYEPMMKNILNELAPQKKKIATKAICTLSVLPPNSSYEIHEDKLEKVLSGVIYIGKNNVGTLIHESKNDLNPHEIDWLENKIFFFSRKHEVTWHSYRSSNEKRYTMILNLVTGKKFLHLKTEVGIFKAIYIYFKHLIIKYLKKLRNKLLGN